MSRDGRYKLETTEYVELDFDLAGPGSRFCAWLIDVILKAFIVMVFYFVLLAVFFGGIGAWMDGEPISRALGGWAVAAAIFVLFGIMVFYHVFFEWVMRGQTPGKRQLGLRVIREEGVGMSFTDVLIRNLLRIVDFMPGFYALGGTISMLHPMHKRLGDLAAGTIVVKEGEPDYRAVSDRRLIGGTAEAEVAVPVAAEADAGATATLDAAERQLLERFFSRRANLTLEARATLADRLARPLHQRYGGQWDHAEAYLERLLEGRHDAP